MSKKNSNAPAARGGVTVLCFLFIIVGQAYLLRSMLFTGDAGSLSAVFYAEIAFCLLMAAGIVICCVRPTGWGGKTGCVAALVLFVLYAAVTVLNYNTFASAYLTGFPTEYTSTGSAFVALKLVLALVGVTAGIPAAPRMDDREYARRLREKVQLQNAEWAKASAKGAQNDLDATLAKLKASLSEEEMAALLAQLQEAAQKDAPSAAAGSAVQPDASEALKPSASEDLHGWGGGM